MSFLLEGITAVTWQQAVMYVVGIILIWLAVKKEYEPSLLLPLGFGAILVNLPYSGVVDQMVQGKVPAAGIIEWLFKTGIEASEAMPILLFIGIGAMIDFGPLLSQPVLFLFGAAAQFGIFAAILIACLMGFDLRDAASIGIIGAADGPTSILVSQVLGSRYIGPIAVAAYSYMALVPIIQPFAIRLVTTRKERCIHMEYNPKSVNKQLANRVSHCRDHHSGPDITAVRGPGGLPYVRKPASGMRRPGKPEPDGPERVCQYNHTAPGHHHLVQHESRAVCEPGYIDDYGSGTGGLCIRHHRRRAFCQAD